MAEGAARHSAADDRVRSRSNAARSRQRCRVTHRSFFFSSRRRHTRCSRDWSSDVCSSDLAGLQSVTEITGATWKVTAAKAPLPAPFKLNAASIPHTYAPDGGGKSIESLTLRPDRKSVV